MGRARHIAWRGRLRSGSHDHLQYLVFSTNSIASSVGLTSSSAPKGENEIAPATVVANPSSPISNPGGDSAEVTNIMLAHASNKYSYFKSKVRLYTRKCLYYNFSHKYVTALFCFLFLYSKPAGQSNLRLTKMDQNHQTSNCSQNLWNLVWMQFHRANSELMCCFQYPGNADAGCALHILLQ